MFLHVISASGFVMLGMLFSLQLDTAPSLPLILVAAAMLSAVLIRNDLRSDPRAAPPPDPARSRSGEEPSLPRRILMACSPLILALVCEFLLPAPAQAWLASAFEMAEPVVFLIALAAFSLAGALLAHAAWLTARLLGTRHSPRP